MHQVRFQHWEMTSHALLLKGNYFSGKIQLFENNVWRIFIWHRLEDENKQTWVLDLPAPLPFHVWEENKTLFCSGENNTDKTAILACTLGIFQWAWGDIRTASMQAHPGRTPGGSTADMEALATGEGNPNIEVNDGYPMGCGLTLGLEDSDSRYYYGLGERTGFLNKKGRTWTNWTTDEFIHNPDQDPLYQAHPFIIGLSKKNAFGLYVDETWKTVFDLADSEPDRTYIHTEGPTFDVYLIPGPSPKDVIQTFTSFSGRADLPPLWALGMHQCRWSYPDERSVLSIVSEYQKRKIPLDAIWLDIDHMEGYKNFTFSTGRFPNPGRLIQKIREKNIRTVVIVDAGVKKESGYEVYESGKQMDGFIKDRRDNVFIGEVWPSPAVWPDFSREDVRDWWGGCHQFYVDAGVSGIWNDMNEPSVFNRNTKTLPMGTKQGPHWHAEVHNLYGYQMCQATWVGLKKLRKDQRPFVLTRSGFTGIQRYAFVWTGDNHSYWDRMEMSIPMILNLGLSGVPFCGADIGGFSANCNGEMLARWTWLGIFYPFMRNHGGKGSRRQEPWAFGPEYEKIICKAIQFRYQLLPYIYTLTKQASETGIPLMRPLFLEFPDDQQTFEIFNQFLVGPHMLVAPVLRPGQTHRMVYLPAGNWLNFWTGQVLQGNQWYVVPAPLDQVPLFIRGGCAIPFDSSHDFTNNLATGNAQWEHITWHIALDSQISGQVYKDDGDGYQPGQTLELSGTYTADKLNLNLNYASQDIKTTIALHGVPLPLEANVPFLLDRHVLLLDMESDHIQVEW